MKSFRPLAVMLGLAALFTPLLLFSEGTPQLAPNGSIDINGNTTNDVAALHIDNDQFNNFASFDNVDVNSRLHIHITDPSTECIYLGFSFGHLNNTSPNPTRQNFEYRIKDPAGNIVFGPKTINSHEAHIQNWQQAVNGPEQLNGAGGYVADLISSADLQSKNWNDKGDYYLEFRNLSTNSPLLIDYWDISVADCSGMNPVEKPGRVWSYNWSLFAINDFGFPNRPFNGAFYVCAPDPVDPDAAFITQIDFNGSGFRPAAFNVAFNSFGTANTGDINNDRRSVENMNLTQPEYAIFLNDPLDICRTAQGGSIDIIGISACDNTDYCIKFISTRSGQIDLLLDFDGRDNIFTPNSRDVMLTAFVRPGEVRKELCLDWDGRDGLGDAVFQSAGTEIPVTLSFAQGIYHFPIYDAELMTEGFQIRAVRPGGPDPLLFYDDRNISVPSGSGEPPIQLMGCDLPCHAWNNYTNPGTIGFGNLNTINSWWFSQQFQSESVFLLPAYYVCEIEGPEFICAGDSVVLNAMEEILPEDSFVLDINSMEWKKDGQSIASDTSIITVSEAGTYEYTLSWISLTGDLCTASCSYELLERQGGTSSIDTLIDFGDTVIINSEAYFQEGSYIQTLVAGNGCDSIITIEISLRDPVYTCEIIGDSPICFGDTTTLDVVTRLVPSDAMPLPITSIEWSGPGLGPNVTGEEISVTRQGTYIAVVNWLNASGENRFTDCSFELRLNPRFAISIDTILLEGETLDISGLSITEPGIYSQVFQTVNGCDSTIFVNVISQKSVILYDLDDCRSIDYSRFDASFPNPLSCAQFEATNVYRINPEANAHSCTPGAGGGVAMCISSLESCDYSAGDEKSLIFEIVVSPSQDSLVQLTSLSFFERAPEEYQWIVGPSGLNNYPLLYGLRVLKNNEEIFRVTDEATSLDWTREVFNFSGIEEFRVEEPSLFRFELLAYCLSGADSHVTAWDIDQISIQADCIAAGANRSSVSGRVVTMMGDNFDGVDVYLENTGAILYQAQTRTDAEGQYAFHNLKDEQDYRISIEHDTDHLNGVSTMDIIKIQRHILGLERFDNPHQFIAADIDRSESISALDIIELKKLILGIYDDFPNNTSWRFHDASQEVSLNNPWTIREFVAVTELTGKKLNANMNAIKVGDVTMDESLKNRNREQIKSNAIQSFLYAQDFELKAGVTQEVIFTIDTPEEYIGFQLALHLRNLEITEMLCFSRNNTQGLSCNVKDKHVIISFHDLSDNFKGDDLEILMRLTSEKNQLLSEAVSLEEKSFSNEIYFNDTDEAHKLEIKFEDFSHKYENLVVQIVPNPFIDNCRIYYTLDNDEPSSVKVFTLDGRLIYSRAYESKAGNNQVVIQSSELGNYRGVLFLDIRAGKHQIRKKIIRY